MKAFQLKCKEKKNSFETILPWAYISEYQEGIVVQKSGLLQKSFIFRGPDLESAAAVYFNDICIRLNEIFKWLGSGWAFQIEAKRFESKSYPGTDFDNYAAFLVDKEREKKFQTAGVHYESDYYLTIIYEPPTDTQRKVFNLFIHKNKVSDNTSECEAVETLLQVANDIYALLSKSMSIAPLDNNQTYQFLHDSISFQQLDLIYNPGNEPFYLDATLPDEQLINCSPIKLGDYYIPILTIKGFPRSTYPAILDKLNAAECEYRWVSRFICYDKELAKKEIQNASDIWFGARGSWKDAIVKTVSGEDTGRINKAAVVQGDDADDAGIGIETDEYSLGNFTACLMVWDKDKKNALKKLTYMKSIIQERNFTCHEEKSNRFEAFKSMMPGNVYANIRRTNITSLNFAHIVPSSAIWAGDFYNSHTASLVGVSSPLCVCSTGYRTPFYLNLNIGDVGNFFLVGPVGAGKSTALQMIEIQFLKYPGARVYILDKGRSARQLTMAVGGKYFEPGTSSVTFQPLEHLETYEDKLWACEFIEGLLVIQNITITTEITQDIKTAIDLLSDTDVCQHTITTLKDLVQNQTVKDGLTLYTLKGKYGAIFDSDSTSISSGRWLMLEMENLMRLGDACITPALSFIFHFLDRSFDGTLSLLILDEAFLFFRNKYFAEKFHEWLKTLRKKNVWVGFATQEVADIVNSPLCSTITQQCLTKIYLADKEATTPALSEYYEKLGLTNAEIEQLSYATMKQDYYYKSPHGTRMFQFDLDSNGVTLALIGGQDHEKLDELEHKHEEIFMTAQEKFLKNIELTELEKKHYVENYEYADDILTAKGVKL